MYNSVSCDVAQCVLLFVCCALVFIENKISFNEFLCIFFYFHLGRAMTYEL